ncbi:MAG: hypothetical protein ACOCXA_00305 [Planctomycetota bacterium]
MYRRPHLADVPLRCVLLAATALVPVLASEAPPPASQADRQAVAQQLADIRIDLLIQGAAERQGAGEHAQAVDLLQEARLLAETLAHPDREERLARIDVLIEAARQQRRQRSLAEQAQRRQASQQGAIDLRHETRHIDRTLFAERLRRVLALQQKGFLELALEQVRLLVTDYPDEELAQEAYVRLLEETHEQRRLDTDERMQVLKQELNERTYRSLIPRGFDGAPTFPDDWHRRSRREVGIIGDVLPEESLALRNQLAARISVSFDAMEPAECIDFLSNRLGINMVVDAEVRAAPPGLVTINARNMRVDNLLNWIVQQVDLQWRIESEAIFVTGSDDSEVFTRVYDVAPLLYILPDFPSIEVGFNAGDDALAQFEQDFTDEDTGLAPEDLSDLIVQTLGERLWERPGHGLSVYGTQLIATCTDTMHGQLQAFLARLQQTEDVLVNVQARWVRLNKSFVEEIGVDWQDAVTNPVFPTGSDQFIEPGAIVSDGDDDPTNDRLGWWDDGDDWFTAGHLVNRLPVAGGSRLPISPGAGNVGLTLSYGYLGSLQLMAVFQAVEQRQQGRFLDAIEITTRNGVQGNAFLGRSLAYISDYEVAENADGIGSAYDPVISVLNVGMGLEIRPLVSADRKYITLDFEPMLVTGEIGSTSFLALDNLRFNVGGEEVIVVDDGNPDTIIEIEDDEDDDDVIVLIGFPNEFVIMTPRLEIIGAHTRVMIPDRGSVLIGGFRQSMRESSKAQVPVLGNIPFLGRLFGRRGRYEADRDLYLMASAKIFLYQELEAQL